MVASLLESLPLWDPSRVQPLVDLTLHLSAYQQRSLLKAMLNYLDIRYLIRLPNLGNKFTRDASELVGGCAAFVNAFVSLQPALVDHLSELCVNIETSILARSYGLRKVVLVVLSTDAGKMTLVYALKLC